MGVIFLMLSLCVITLPPTPSPQGVEFLSQNIGKVISGHDTSRLLKNLQTYIFVILSEAKNLVFSGS